MDMISSVLKLTGIAGAVIIVAGLLSYGIVIWSNSLEGIPDDDDDDDI